MDVVGIRDEREFFCELSDLADRFVGMYVNDWTLDYGDRGRAAISDLLARGHAAGLIPKVDQLEFVG